MVDLSINLLFQKKPPGKLIGVSLVFCNPIRDFSLKLQLLGNTKNSRHQVMKSTL